MTPLDWQSCTPISSQSEYEVFDRVMREYHAKAGRDLSIIEIGSYRGQSTVLLAQYGFVFAVDLWGDIHDGVAHTDTIGKENLLPFIETMVRFDLIGKRVFPIVSTSRVLGFLPILRADVAYVDASHYYEPAKTDIEQCVRHLSQDGLLVCHDYKRPGDSPLIGVNRAVDELIESSEWKIKEHYNGIVFLQRN